MQKLISIVGPTGSGKSALALEIAKNYDGYIIVADSRQIYKGMDIGTDKFPVGSKIQRKKDKVLIDGISHYMIDLINPDENFTVGEYKSKVDLIIKRKKGHPILSGGTGLYIQAVIDNYQIPKVEPDYKLRKLLEKKSCVELTNWLLKLDPDSLNFVQKHNKRRLVRALEVCLKTGKKFSKLRKKGKKKYDTLILGLKIDDKNKYIKKLRERVDIHIKNGLIEEVKNLISKYPKNLEPFKGISYKEIILYLEGKINLEQAKELIVRNNLLYAKRQLGWFKKDKRIIWIKSKSQAFKLVEKFYEKKDFSY